MENGIDCWIWECYPTGTGAKAGAKAGAVSYTLTNLSLPNRPHPEFRRERGGEDKAADSCGHDAADGDEAGDEDEAVGGGGLDVVENLKSKAKFNKKSSILSLFSVKSLISRHFQRACHRLSLNPKI
jgi:hypothetical protein